MESVATSLRNYYDNFAVVSVAKKLRIPTRQGLVEVKLRSHLVPITEIITYIIITNPMTEALTPKPFQMTYGP